jgi:putative sporulation protein YyaC
MTAAITQNQKIYYYNSKNQNSIYDFCKNLIFLLNKKTGATQDVILLCIGSDRATGDCLGPIIGYKLSKLQYPHLFIYGTLENPVHAKNLNNTLAKIKHRHTNAFIIAIDASLGACHHIGYITLGEGPLSPGIGVDKELPYVGDIFITGIVNMSSMLNHMLLQTTRLDIVMKLADFICLGIKYSIINSSKI